MHRPNVTGAVFLLACAVLSAGAQQSAAPSNSNSNQDQYQGQSNPPADDAINVAAPEQQATPLSKPPAAHRELQPAQAVPSPAMSHPTSVDPAMNFPAADDPDGGTVQVAPDPEPAPAREPTLQTRSRSDDPDGDMVHPTMPPGVLAEGAMIRARLLTRLSTVDSQVGDTFRARIASDVMQDGNVLIPAGAEIEGRVVEVSGGSWGGHGSMRLRPQSITLLDGARYRLDAQVVSTPGTNARVSGEGTINAGSRAKKDGIEYGGAVGAGAATGAVLGGPVGALAGTLVGAGAVTVHLLNDHPQAVLEPGTVLMFALNQRLNLVSADKASNENGYGDRNSSEQ